MPRWLAIIWGLLAVLGLGLWLGLVATSRSRADLTAVVVAADPLQPTTQERDAADDLLLLELGASTPDPGVVSSAWSLLAAGPGADRARAAIGRRLEGILGAELARARPDAARLRLGHDLAAVLGPESAAAVHARIAARAGDRSEAAAGLVAMAANLRRGDAGILAVERTAAAWEDLRRAGTGPDGLTWAALETPPVTDAVADAGDALRGRLVAQLRTPGPERRAMLLAIWSCLQRLDQAGACPPALVARYADAVRRDEVPAVGLLIAVLVSALLFGGTALAYRRLARGIRTIDPGAETMEGVDAVDLDTDAVTVQRNTTGEETRVE
jgi:hypothetical protein